MSPGRLALGIALVALILLVVSRSSTRDVQPDVDAGESAAEPASPPAALEEAKRGRVRTAVVMAAGAADCGYTEVGYDFRSAEDEAARLVETLSTAQGSGDVAYALGPIRKPWTVVIHAAPDGSAVLLDGYGASTDAALRSERVAC